MKNRSLKHWIVLIVACSLSAASMGLGNTAGIFFESVSKYLDVSATLFSIHVTILFITASVATLFVPKVINKYPYKPILFISATIGALATGLMAISDSLLIIFILAGIRGITSAFFGLFIVSLVVNRWFDKKHGLAMGVVFAFSAGSTALFSPIFANIIINYDWQTAYIIKGVLTIALCLPALIYPFNFDPQDDNLLAYGYEEKTVTQENNILEKEKPNTLILSSFILFTLFISLIAIITTLSQQFPTFATSIGFDLTVGAALVSAAMIGNVVSKLFIGVISDMFGAIKAVLIMIALNVIGILMLMHTTDTLLLYFAAFLFGAIFSVGSVGGILLFKHFFGVKLFPKLYPVTSLILGTFAAVAIPLISLIYSATETFEIIFIISLIIHVVAFVSLMYVVYRQKTNLDKEEQLNI